MRSPLLISAAALVVLAQGAGATPLPQPVCSSRESPVPPATWAPPLDQIVSFSAADVSLKDALDRLAARAHFRLSYSAEALPLDRQVCLALDSAAVGDVLATLLQGTGVQPVVAANDYVVLTPPTGPIMALAHPIELERIVVTGSAMGAGERPLPVAIDVLSGRDLARQQVNNLSDALSAAVPGEFLWASSPTSLLSQYGSIRGASSLGLSYPKVYIDGIEVANPLLITRLSPDAIDRVEVIRGPQGAALYGADAISGITNIVSRQDYGAEGEPRVKWQSDVGAASSQFATSPTLRQDHEFAFSAGSSTQSAGINVGYTSDGAFVPGAYARSFNALGSARAVGAKAIWTGIVRFLGEQAASPVSPLLLDSIRSAGVSNLTVTTPGTQSVMEYTVGTTLKIMPSANWKHTITLGVDGYTLDGLPDDGTPLPSAADSALLAARGNALRATFRASSVRSIDLGSRAAADVTLAAEHTELRQSVAYDTTRLAERTGHGPGRGGPAFSSETIVDSNMTDTRSNSALSGMVSASLDNRFFASGGLRVESATGADETLIPMVGGAIVNDVGPATVKLRAAYGKGVRYPETTPRQAMYYGEHVDERSLGTPLQPETQAGIEAGIDVLFARTLTLQVTRFDQTASGLIQRVAMTHDTASAPASGYGPGNPPARQMYYQLQNVGDVTNRGWEMAGTLRGGPFALTATLALVDSRVKSLSPSYDGDLRVGDRMLEVPSRTASVSASFASGHWATSFTVYGAEDWVNYDRLALTAAYTSDTLPSRDLVGPALRNFWRAYDGIAHARASVTFYLRRDLGWTLTGDNLFDKQIGEPDNVTVLPGRTFSLGMRAQF